MTRRRSRSIGGSQKICACSLFRLRSSWLSPECVAVRARRKRTGRLRPLRVPGSRVSARTLPPPRRLSGASRAGHSRPAPLQLMPGPRIAQTEVDVRNRCGSTSGHGAPRHAQTAAAARHARGGSSGQRRDASAAATRGRAAGRGRPTQGRQAMSVPTNCDTPEQHQFVDRAAGATAQAARRGYDVLIAGQASARALILVTHNTGEFGRVPGLHIEDWARPRGKKRPS